MKLRTQIYSYPQGFTLIELLVVIVIIGIIATIATFYFGDRIQQARTDALAKELAMILPLAEEEAMLRPAQIGLVLTQQRYAFVEFNPNNQSWTSLTDAKAFSGRAIPDSIELDLQVNGNSIHLSSTATQSPQIIFYSSGNLTPFVIQIGLQNQAPDYQVIGQASGEVTLVHLQQPNN